MKKYETIFFTKNEVELYVYKNHLEEKNDCMYAVCPSVRFKQWKKTSEKWIFLKQMFCRKTMVRPDSIKDVFYLFTHFGSAGMDRWFLLGIGLSLWYFFEEGCLLKKNMAMVENEWKMRVGLVFIERHDILHVSINSKLFPCKNRSADGDL